MLPSAWRLAWRRNVPDSNGYLVAAYAVTWFVLVAYAVRLHRVARRAEQDYAEAARGDATSEGGRR